MILGEPNLSEVERKRSEGVMVLYYTDDDYRCRWFGGDALLQFTRERYLDADDPTEEAMIHLPDEAVECIKENLIPPFKSALVNMRAEEGEPQQAGWEIYWGGKLIHQEAVEAYEPITLTSTPAP